MGDILRFVSSCGTIQNTSMNIVNLDAIGDRLLTLFATYLLDSAVRVVRKPFMPDEDSLIIRPSTGMTPDTTPNNPLAAF